jgi:hypothetical protein
MEPLAKGEDFSLNEPAVLFILIPDGESVCE